MSTGSMNDAEFAKSFAFMIAGFVVLTLILIALGIIMASDVTERIGVEKASEKATFVADRVSPVETAVVGAAPAATQVAAVAKSGEDVYNTGCNVCHQAGVADAPKFADKDGWQDRIAQGVDALYQNAIAGIRGMPAKGGNAALTDDEVRSAVDYMLDSVK